KVSGKVSSAANLSIFSIQYSKPFSDSASDGTKIMIDLFDKNGLTNLHINKLAFVRFKILSVFSHTILSFIYVSVGQPMIRQSARSSFEVLPIPLAMLKSIVDSYSASISEPVAYCAMLSKFFRAFAIFRSA